MNEKVISVKSSSDSEIVLSPLDGLFLEVSSDSEEGVVFGVDSF